MAPEDLFASLVASLAGEPGVEPPGDGSRRAFGSTALKVDGAIFAMLTRGDLVVKLPEDRVAALVASGVGAPFGTGGRRPMREWLTVTSDDPATCAALAREALAFVGRRGR